MNEGMNEKGPSNDDYETPKWLFKALDAEFGLTWDAAAQAGNSLCENWSDNIDNVIFGPRERVFCNPPYSNIEKFVNKALRSDAALWVLLLPNRTDTGWFRDLVESSRVELRFLRKRVRFCLGGKETDSPRFGSVIVIVRPR